MRIGWPCEPGTRRGVNTSRGRAHAPASHHRRAVALDEPGGESHGLDHLHQRAEGNQGGLERNRADVDSPSPGDGGDLAGEGPGGNGSSSEANAGDDGEGAKGAEHSELSEWRRGYRRKPLAMAGKASMWRHDRTKEKARHQAGPLGCPLDDEPSKPGKRRRFTEFLVLPRFQ